MKCASFAHFMGLKRDKGRASFQMLRIWQPSAAHFMGRSNKTDTQRFADRCCLVVAPRAVAAATRGSVSGRRMKATSAAFCSGVRLSGRITGGLFGASKSPPRS